MVHLNFIKYDPEITKWLIQEHRFSIMAVEGDWPSCQAVNRYIKGYDKGGTVKQTFNHFNRWPTWMWANEEIMELAEWLRNYNQSKPKTQKVGFYGLDVYSLWESMEEILKYFKESGRKEELEMAIKAFSCFEHFHKDEEKYAVSAAFFQKDVQTRSFICLKKYK